MTSAPPTPWNRSCWLDRKWHTMDSTLPCIMYFTLFFKHYNQSGPRTDAKALKNKTKTFFFFKFTGIANRWKSHLVSDFCTKVCIQGDWGTYFNCLPTEKEDADQLCECVWAASHRLWKRHYLCLLYEKWYIYLVTTVLHAIVVSTLSAYPLHNMNY